MGFYSKTKCKPVEKIQGCDFLLNWRPHAKIQLISMRRKKRDQHSTQNGYAPIPSILLQIMFVSSSSTCYDIQGVENDLSKKFGSHKILVDFHGSRSLVFSAVVCVLESRFF